MSDSSRADKTIEGMEQTNVTYLVHRLANIQSVAKYGALQGLSVADLEAINDFIPDNHCPVKQAFTAKNQFPLRYGDESRFSDGTWPVYYSALSRETAQLEAAHTYARLAAGSKNKRRAVFYNVILCKFSGRTVDLHKKHAEWPELTANDHSLCQKLAKEGRAANLDGFLTPSARHPKGTCLPIFVKRAISNVSGYGKSKISFDPEGGIPLIEEMDDYRNCA